MFSRLLLIFRLCNLFPLQPWEVGVEILGFGEISGLVLWAAMPLPCRPSSCTLFCSRFSRFRRSGIASCRAQIRLGVFLSGDAKPFRTASMFRLVRRRSFLLFLS